MKLSLRALRRFVDFNGSAQECADIFAELGFPSDGIQSVGAGIEGVVLGKILEKKAHPQADRLSLLQVEVADKNRLPIVCGAQNMKEGDFVALAGVGAKIPAADGQGMKLKKAKIRGETSEGMCCSEVELGLSESSEGIWIIPPEDLGPQPEQYLGRDLVQLMGLNDDILEIDVTPNRGDALSVRGLARELAAKCGLKLRNPAGYRWKNPHQSVQPQIESFEDAYGFAACLVKKVKMQKSPWAWQQFLAAQGARSLGSLIDISNIVMFELGHPMHFFDAEKVDPQSIQIRRARDGESLKLLNDQTIQLHPEDLVVADQSGPLSLAGIMGGASSSVSETTTQVLIEVAAFDPAKIRASAKRHQLSSESCFRFERGLTAFRLDEIVERALSLLQEVGGFESAMGTKIVSRNQSRASCLWNRARVESKLGKLTWTDNEIFDQLRGLEYELEPRSSVPHLIFPWYRTDGSELEDVMEDIARLVGYENLERKRLRAEESVSVLEDFRSIQSVGDQVLDRFVSQGFAESVHLSFSNRKLESDFVAEDLASIELLNPIHAEKPHLRRLILPQLLERAAYNAAHGEEEIRLVEWGPVFSWAKDSNYQNSPSSEIWHMAAIWYPRPVDKKRLWSPKHDEFFQFKGELEKIFSDFQCAENLEASEVFQSQALHPKRQWKCMGGLAGELHPLVADRFQLKSRCFVVELSLHPVSLRSPQYRTSHSYPSIDLDVSLSIEQGLPIQSILDAFQAQSEDLLEWVRAYDIYQKAEDDETRAVTFALRYRSKEATLELEEAKRRHEALVQGVLKAFPGQKIALR